MRAGAQKQEERDQGTNADIMEYNDRVVERGPQETEGISVITRQSIRTALRSRR